MSKLQNSFLNPISSRFVQLGSSLHRKLIRDGIVDVNGNSLREKKIKSDKIMKKQIPTTKPVKVKVKKQKVVESEDDVSQTENDEDEVDDDDAEFDSIFSQIMGGQTQKAKQKKITKQKSIKVKVQPKKKIVKVKPVKTPVVYVKSKKNVQDDYDDVSVTEDSQEEEEEEYYDDE